MRFKLVNHPQSIALALGLLVGQALAAEDIFIAPVQYIASSPGGEPKTPPNTSAVAACMAYQAIIQSVGAGPGYTFDYAKPSCAESPSTTYWGHWTYPDGTVSEPSPEASVRTSSFCPAGSTTYDGRSCVVRQIDDNSCKTKNPVSPGSGEKFFYETDYQGAGAHPLDFQRLYRSNYRGLPAQANGWIHNWQRAISVISAPTATGSTANVQYADGKHAAFKYNGRAWVIMTNGRFDTLTEIKTGDIRTGWQLKIWENDSVEHYSSEGQLLKIVQRNGWTNTITYSTATTAATVAPFAGLPITITNNFGRQLQLQYNAIGQLIKLIDPAGGIIQYGYDSSFNLTQITWQDNTVKQYLYVNPADGRLTGVIDELGVRIGTFSYDTQGRVISSEKANGAEKLTFSYGSNSTTIKDIISAKTITHSFGTAQGVIRPTNISGASPLCGNTAAATTYDANGNVTQRNEHDGTITKFTYDAKNRETSRVEAAGTAAAKTYTMQWHATWNLPLLKTEPLKITAYTYDAKGNLTGQAETPTTDASGAKGAAGVRDVTKPVLANGWIFDANNLTLATTRTSTPHGLTSIYLEKLSSTYDIYGNAIVVKDLVKNINYPSIYDSHDNITNSLDYNGKILQQIFNNKGLLVYYKYGDLSFDFSYFPNQNPKPTIVKFKNNVINEMQLENLLQGVSTPANSVSPFSWIPFSSAHAQSTFMPSYSPICGACNAGPSARLGGVIKKGVELLKKCFVKPKDSNFGKHPNQSDAAKRGWSKKDIDDAINSPDKTVPTKDIRNNPETGQRNNDPATAYYRGNDYVVRNDNTGQIVQISNKAATDWKVPF